MSFNFMARSYLKIRWKATKKDPLYLPLVNIPGYMCMCSHMHMCMNTKTCISMRNKQSKLSGPQFTPKFVMPKM